MEFYSDKFLIFHQGLSRDLRTNKWRFICKKCKKYWNPITTMLNEQTITCPKCGITDTINYNNLKKN